MSPEGQRRPGRPRDTVLAMVISTALVIGGGVLIATDGFGGNERSSNVAAPGQPRGPRSPAGSSNAPTQLPSPQLTVLPTLAPASPPAGIRLLAPAAVSASRSAPSVPRSNGVVDSYGPRLAVDGQNATAWCVPGDGTGQFLELLFSSPVRVGAVGIIPGYDKIDPVTGADRFAENRKIVTVRYAFSGGTPVQATYSQDVPLQALRGFQFTRVDPPVDTIFVRIEPVATTLPSRPDRDFTCISEVVVLGSG